MGKVATSPLPPGGSPPLQSGGQNQRWPTTGQGGYITPAAWGVPTASERGTETEVALTWPRWLRNLCRLGGPHRFSAGGTITSGPQVGKVATKPLPPRGPHPLRVGGIIRGGPQVGNVATSPLPPRGSPQLESEGQKQKWPSSGQGGSVTSASWGSLPLQSGGQNQKWPASGQGGYITPAAWGVPTA